MQKPFQGNAIKFAAGTAFEKFHRALLDKNEVNNVMSKRIIRQLSFLFLFIILPRKRHTEIVNV